MQQFLLCPCESTRLHSLAVALEDLETAGLAVLRLIVPDTDVVGCLLRVYSQCRISIAKVDQLSADAWSNTPLIVLARATCSSKIDTIRV